MIELTTLKDAQILEKEISEKLGYPLVATSGRTGEPDSTMQATTRWSDITEESGKFYIPNPETKTDLKLSSLETKIEYSELQTVKNETD